MKRRRMWRSCSASLNLSFPAAALGSDSGSPGGRLPLRAAIAASAAVASSRRPCASSQRPLSGMKGRTSRQARDRMPAARLSPRHVRTPAAMASSRNSPAWKPHCVAMPAAPRQEAPTLSVASRYAAIDMP